jgi:acetyltransferase-like isoleucine patch superfamily enzyme
MSHPIPNTPARFEDPLSLIPRAVTKLFSLWVSATYPFASKGSNFSIHYTAMLSRQVAPAIKLGNSVMIGKDAWINTFDILDGDSELKIIIDDNCLIGARDVISAKNLIHIERDVIIATSVLIQDHNHAYEDIGLPIRAQGLTPGGTIRIERGCRIGQGVAIVCPQGELVLGQHSVVTPNSVVLRSTAPYSLVGGNPARVIERLDSSHANPESPGSSTGGMVSKASPLDYSPEASRTMPHHGKAE